MKRKLSLSLKHFGVGVVLLLTVAGSSAITLGRVRGPALLGQELEVAVPVQIAADEDASALCFNADVYYGDNRVDPARVSVSSSATQQGSDSVVRVLVRQRIDEPVVTVYLRSGCGLQATRKYVLLADMPSEPAAQSPVGRGPLTPSVTVATGQAGDVGSKKQSVAGGEKESGQEQNKGGGLAALRASQRPSGVGKSGQALVATEKTPSPRVEGHKQSKQIPSQKARLKLESLDLSVELDPVLKSSDELRSEPKEDAKLRADATIVWKALTASPEDVLKDAQNAQATETKLKQLQQQTTDNQKSITDLVARLDKAESERYANPVIYGLIALLSFATVGGFWVLRRKAASATTESPWWRGEFADESSIHNSILGLDEAAGAPKSKPAEASSSAKAKLESLAEARVEMPAHVSKDASDGRASPDSLLSAFALPAQSSQGFRQRDFAHSTDSGMRAVKAKELIDVRHQADFYVALGQYDEALAVLEGHIRDAEEADPLVYLDLLNVLHTLSRKPAFDTYREKFNACFTGYVPEFEIFTAESAALDSYPQLCAQLTELWPSPDALGYMERCLVRDPQLPLSANVTLDAFKDLLMLHAVLKRVMAPSESVLVPFSVRPVPQAPALALSSVLEAPSHAVATTSVDLALDLDLSEQSDNLINFEPPKPE
ncbi:hypothetical protein [Rhodoferax aquaticus]|uniref:Uncharacterized protein n=1 Tax=Rhodoferax aquaticus TaxID=2527691 RepID=A0A515EN07_9BURK|nr:hypothetical protein [Rhodoferax aquaticus]QDL54041.1 hypothetical protein EXZ61_07590 [Rhodoferax aquaticus]